MDGVYTVKRCDDCTWEQLIDPNGKVIAEAHSLDAEDVLEALGLKYISKEDWEDTEGSDKKESLY